MRSSRRDRSLSDAHRDAPTVQRAPGRQSLTARLPATHLESPPPPLLASAASPARPAGDDPFGLHLIATPVQQHGPGGPDDTDGVRAAAARGVAGGATALPFATEIQASFGAATDVSRIAAHVGGAAREACDDMDAAAFATGDHVAFAAAPDLHTAAHEAAHVVQQAHGVNLYGGVGAVGDAYEAHADAVADRVVAGDSAEALLAAGPAAAGPAGAGRELAEDPTAEDPTHDEEDAADEAAAEPGAEVVQHRRRASGGRRPRGLGDKLEGLLAWKQEMIEVAQQLAGEFVPLGLHFRPQILLATALQESAPTDPLTARSFDNGLGLMQITAYRGKLDPQVARAIGWDNTKGLAHNIQNSRWRDARANLLAGGYTMLGKARAIKRGAARVWEQMDEAHRWRAVLFAYNAGEAAAIRALRAGGPDAAMISSFVNPKGKRVSHDYTKELQEKMDFVDSHDPFAGADVAEHAPAAAPASESAEHDRGGDEVEAHPADRDAEGEVDGGAAAATPAHPRAADPARRRRLRRRLAGSVGRGGRNRARDVTAVQTQLADRGHSPGPVDGLAGPRTIHAIEGFQQATLGLADGLISPGRRTEARLFGDDGGAAVAEPERDPELA